VDEADFMEEEVDEELDFGDEEQLDLDWYGDGGGGGGDDMDVFVPAPSPSEVRANGGGGGVKGEKCPGGGIRDEFEHLSKMILNSERIDECQSHQA
jgi:hypothetical protein